MTYTIIRRLYSSGSGWCSNCALCDTGGIIWEVEGRGSGSKGVAYHTDSPTQVEDLGLRLGLVSLYTPLLPLHRPSTSQIILPVLCDTNLKFGTMIDYDQTNILRYRAIADLSCKQNGGHFSKWPPTISISNLSQPLIVLES